MCWDPLPPTVAPLLPWDSATILRWFSSNRKEQPADAAGRLKRLDYFQSANGPLVASTDYTLDARGRRTASAREDGVGWAWGYNDRGEVTSGARGQAAYRYRYDDIGNRVEAAVDGFDEAAQRTSYDANALNQYTAIHHPDPARRRVQGSAHMQAAIEAKASAPGAAPGDAVALPVARGGPQGSAFSATAEAAVGDGAAWRRIEVTATRPAVGVGGGAMRTAREGWQYFPPKEEAPLHDHDGNLTSDARWLYWWDGENRLTAMEEKGGATGPVASAAGSAVPKRQRLEFAYDGESRRVRKRVLEWSAEMNSWVLRRDVRFLYDGWSMIAEFEARGGAGVPLALSATYAWGLDLSGTETGAGGVGGLLFVSLYSTTQTTVSNSQPPPTSVLAPCYDGNGNVLAYVDTVSGAVVARYEYDPFGQVMIREEAASVAGRLHHQFSTKYADAETGLVYYGYRYYSPELGRWVNRDPIGENGGVNLYEIVGNNCVDRWDYVGLFDRCGCDSKRRVEGERSLEAQKEKFDPEIAAEGIASCFDSHWELISRLEIPVCWECRLECRKYLKIPSGAGIWRKLHRIAAQALEGDYERSINHCVVMCQTRGETGFIYNEIILDITGGITTPQEFRRRFPYLMPQGDPDGASGPWYSGTGGSPSR